MLGKLVLKGTGLKMFTEFNLLFVDFSSLISFLVLGGDFLECKENCVEERWHLLLLLRQSHYTVNI